MTTPNLGHRLRSQARWMDVERDAAYDAMLSRPKRLTDALWAELYPPPAASPITDPAIEALLLEAVEYLREQRDQQVEIGPLVRVGPRP